MRLGKGDNMEEAAAGTLAMAVAREIAEGRRLGRGDDLGFLLDAPLEALGEGADLIRHKLSGERVDLCTILAARSGACSEDCAYCAQAARHATDCSSHGLLEVDEIVAAGRASDEGLADRFAIVTSGRALDGPEFERALEALRRMRDELGIGLCASMGLLDRARLERLRDAGVTRYHCNIETSRRHFPRICTTHAFDDKIATIRAAREAGLDVCSGGIIGMGETWEDRLDMALELAGLGVRSIPLNVLVAIPGTPLEGLEPLPEDEILRTAAAFRYLVPEADVRLAGGRRLLPDTGERAFSFGVSAAITGNMLTTEGPTIASDRAMLAALGRPAGRNRV